MESGAERRHFGPAPRYQGKTNLNQLCLGRDICGDFDQAIEREWLVTNGLGGYASGTVGEVNTRRYHGLLMAALAPPAERTLLVAKIDVWVRYGGGTYPLFSNEYTDGTIDPHGSRWLESFHLERGMPVWRYAFADALIEKRVLMKPGRNITYLHLSVPRAGDSLQMELIPLCTYRDYHSHGHGGWDLGVAEIPDGFEVNAFTGAHSYRVTCKDAEFHRDPAWYWNFRHRAESARGLDDTEDLFCPGRFVLRLEEGQSATVVMSADAAETETFVTVQAQVRAGHDALLEALPGEAPDWIRQLVLASDQFIVERRRGGKAQGATVIAGYPWFGDWGRDTMIALPGLALVTRRYGVAASILCTFAAHASDGMLPNRFPDHADGQPLEYNTVDATLWYFHAVYQYIKHTGDRLFLKELYPLLTDIIEWHRRGTRYGIKVDPRDGLLAAGEEGVQLTWMDAKVGDWVVTPRIGKAVEVNALWYNALLIMAELAVKLGKKRQANDYRSAADSVRSSFGRFWNDRRGCLYDVIDGPEGGIDADGRRYDARLRPNQIFAVSLPFSPLAVARQKAVVDICAKTLLTSYGLRSLAPGDGGYVPHYTGGPSQRDAAYHQGTVWAWLIGPFVDAHFRVYRDRGKAMSFLEPMGRHLTEACLGTVSEIFDGEPPHTPRGCYAQAWSVAEVLRAWSSLHGDQKLFVTTGRLEPA